MNRLRIIIQFLRESNDLDKAKYSSLILELSVPELGHTANPAISRMYLGKSYREYRADGGVLGLNGYSEMMIVEEDLEEVYWAVSGGSGSEEGGGGSGVDDADIYIDSSPHDWKIKDGSVPNNPEKVVYQTNETSGSDSSQNDSSQSNQTSNGTDRYSDLY